MAHVGRDEAARAWQRLTRGPAAQLGLEITDLGIYYKTAKDQLKQMANEGKSAEDAYEFLYEESR